MFLVFRKEIHFSPSYDVNTVQPQKETSDSSPITLPTVLRKESIHKINL